MEMQSEKCPPNTPLPKKKQNTNKWLSLPLRKKESKRKQNVDVDTEQVIFDHVKLNLKKKNTGRPYFRRKWWSKLKENTRWNLKAFWNHVSTKKPGDELYLLESLTSSDNETSDESDD
eukprot:11684111-Ditylum_brightwellii.AAC.1